MIGVTGKTVTNAVTVDYSIDAVNTFVSSCVMLQKQLKQNSHEASTSRKESSKNPFFQLLGYTSLFAPRTKNVAQSLKRREVRNKKRRKVASTKGVVVE